MMFSMHIDSLSFPVSVWLNYYATREMNVVNRRTNILCIHGCNKRTKHKKMSVVTHVFHTLETFIVKKTLPIKAIVQIPKVLNRIHARLHEDMQQVQLGRMLRLKNVLFSSTLPFAIPHISSPH